MLKIETTEQKIIDSFKMLSISELQKVPDYCSYNGGTKAELITEMEKIYSKLKGTGLESLNVEFSSCNFCFPTAKTFSFHNPLNHDFVVRYVIFEESLNNFIIEECRNRKLPDGENGLPF